MPTAALPGAESRTHASRLRSPRARRAGLVPAAAPHLIRDRPAVRPPTVQVSASQVSPRSNRLGSEIDQEAAPPASTGTPRNSFSALNRGTSETRLHSSARYARSASGSIRTSGVPDASSVRYRWAPSPLSCNRRRVGRPRYLHRTRAGTRSASYWGIPLQHRARLRGPRLDRRAASSMTVD